ncbi:hypothetical protein Tco_0479298 [Tanacetum coccineum]
MVVLTKRIDDLTKGKSEKGKNEKGKRDNGTTKIKAFMAIAKDEPSVRKADARSGQWVKITMKKVHRLLFMTDGDERKHVLDYTHVDLHYVDDQRKNLVNKFNVLKQEFSLHKSELCNLKNTISINCSLQNEVIRVNLENESLKNEISDLKRSLKNRLVVDESLIIQAHGDSPLNIDSFECDTQEHLPPLPKLIGAEPTSTSNNLISLADLTSDIAELTLNTFGLEHKSLASLNLARPKANSSMRKLLLTLMEGFKESGPKVVFGDNSSGDTEGYGLVNCYGINFTRVALDHLRKFNEKADDGFFLGYSLVAKAFRVFNIRRQEIEETYHVTFSEDDEEISQSSTEGDAINFNETRSFPDDEFLKPRMVLGFWLAADAAAVKGGSGGGDVVMLVMVAWSWWWYNDDDDDGGGAVVGVAAEWRGRVGCGGAGGEVIERRQRGDDGGGVMVGCGGEAAGGGGGAWRKVTQRVG